MLVTNNCDSDKETRENEPVDLGIVFPLFQENTIFIETVGHSPTSIGSLIGRVTTTIIAVTFYITLLILAQVFYNYKFTFKLCHQAFIFYCGKALKSTNAFHTIDFCNHTNEFFASVHYSFPFL